VILPSGRGVYLLVKGSGPERLKSPLSEVLNRHHDLPLLWAAVVLAVRDRRMVRGHGSVPGTEGRRDARRREEDV